MKPMWTVAVSAMTMTLSVAVMAMVRLSLLTWLVWAEAMVERTTAVSARAETWRVFIGLLLWSRGDRRGWVCVWAWRRASVWGRAGHARGAECRLDRGRWP